MCYSAVQMRERMHIDDALDAFPLHGVGGAVGAILTGVFAGSGVLPQIAAVGAVALYSGFATFAILAFVMRFVPLRVSRHEELAGLDMTQHAEIAYAHS
jgi:Amt family ammonium transporter